MEVSFFCCIFVLQNKNNIKQHNIMETMQNISLIIWKVIWAIVGGTISIAFIAGILGAIGYMIQFAVRNGWSAFEKEFIK